MPRRVSLVIVAGLGLTGCFYGDENADRYATPEQIRAAAARCGLPDFQPTKADALWAAYVDDSVPDHAAKENCIYADLEEQSLLATR